MADEIKLISSFLGVPAGKITKDKETKALILSNQNGQQVKGFLSVIKHLSRKSKVKDVLGRSGEDQAIVDQWLEYRVTRMNGAVQEKNHQIVLKELDSYLADKVFLVGFYCTIADVVLYLGLHNIFNEMSFYDKQKYIHVSRWFDQVQHQPGILRKSKKIYFQKSLIYSAGSSH